MIGALRRIVTPLLAVACCAVAVWFTALPAVSQAERVALAAPFRFTPYPLDASNGPGAMPLRTVAPAYRRVAALISGFGASVALFAADGGKVSRDVCLVDPRDGSVTVEPAPTTGARYRPFTLVPSAGPAYFAPMGCMPADLTESGWTSLVVYYWGRSPVLFLRIPGTAPSRSAFVARELVSPPQVWNTSAATLGDYDGTGHLDLVFGNYYPDGARILDPASRQTGLAMPESMSNARNGGTKRLYRFVSATRGPIPDVHYAEVPAVFDPRDATEWTLALGTQDLTGSGLPDLYIANDFGPDRLLINQSTPGHIRFREARGVRHLTTPKSLVLGNDSFKGMGVAFADLDGSGIPAILVSNITEPYGAMENNFAFVATVDRDTFRRDANRGVADYDDHSEALGLSRTGWSWGVAAADFDNSGQPAIVVAAGFGAGSTNRWPQMQEATIGSDVFLRYPGLWPDFTAGADLSGHDGDKFMVRDRDGRYVDVADLLGVQGNTPGRAIAVGDVDGDGRLDYLMANQSGQSILWHNDSQAGAFLGLRLRVPAGEGRCGAGDPAGPSSPAIGATADLTLPDGTHRAEQVYPDNGNGGFSSPDLHFGLGAVPYANVPHANASHATSSHATVHDAELPVSLTWRDRCGIRHVASVELGAGEHDVLLQPDGIVIAAASMNTASVPDNTPSVRAAPVSTMSVNTLSVNTVP